MVQPILARVAWCVLACALGLCSCVGAAEPVKAEIVPVVDMITDANFTTVALGSGVHVVDFYSRFCGPCRAFLPLFEQFAQDNKSATFSRFECVQDSKADETFHVTKIPTVIVFKDGHEVGRKVGSEITGADADARFKAWVAECAGTEVAGK